MAEKKVTEPFDLVNTETGEIIPFPKQRERKKDKDGNYRGAPSIYITPEMWHTVESVASLFATDEEIADSIQVSTRTLTDEYHGDFFQALKKRGQAKYKISLRRAQSMAAVKNGNTTLLIFLGKQYLGQKDQIEAWGNEPTINISVAPATKEDATEIQ